MPPQPCAIAAASFLRDLSSAVSGSISAVSSCMRERRLESISIASSENSCVSDAKLPNERPPQPSTEIDTPYFKPKPAAAERTPASSMAVRLLHRAHPRFSTPQRTVGSLRRNPRRVYSSIQGFGYFWKMYFDVVNSRCRPIAYPAELRSENPLSMLFTSSSGVIAVPVRNRPQAFTDSAILVDSVRVRQ